MWMSNPFGGDCLPSRVPLFSWSRPSLPFPHLWNYKEPIRILDTYFHATDHLAKSERHNRYLKIPGFPAVLVSRDPSVIKPILLATGDKPGQFDRDTLPTDGIARATGADSLLYANGPLWRAQKKLASPSFGRANLFNPETLSDFESTFRHTAMRRLHRLQGIQADSGSSVTKVDLEPEINVIMLEMLVNNFFGGSVSEDELWDKYVPSLRRLIDHMVDDTISAHWLKPIKWFKPVDSDLEQAQIEFEELTNIALSGRAEGKGLWKRFKSDVSDDLLRSNIRVFLAGAMEATSSFTSWTLSHLARSTIWQEKIYQEVKDIDVYEPDSLKQAPLLHAAMEETLRLTPSLYFLPRKSTVDTWIDTSDNRRLFIPKATHVLLDVWHANRCEDFWGEAITGYPADHFAPDRWQTLANKQYTAKEILHFGFGFGPRTCPGVSLGRLEVALAVGAFVKMFRFSAVDNALDVQAGVSTKPKGGVWVNLEPRAAYT
ncbi:MAG: cytochrome P450 [Gammaproteobacteria bacterium]|nr:cytochrome P450 [Gammaproteobacteria bacterium]